MAQVEFQYNGNMTIIQCQEDQRMEDICNAFINKVNIKECKIYYFYDGKGGSQFNKNLTFNEMANSFDKTRKIMSVLVIDNENINDNKIKIKSKNIICPKCNENIKISIKNYKINLFECKNNHKINNILFDEFQNIQMIDLTKIKCGICNKNNKSNTFNNEFFKCYECNINLCPLCKTQHNKIHNIYNYDKINYLCCRHNELLSNYCNKCKMNLCTLCEKEHFGHEIFSLGKMMVNKDELKLNLEELKKSVNILNNNIKEIMEKLNVIKNNIEIYYNLEEYLMNNYNKNERNFEILYNINELIYYNKNIITDINIINNEKNLENKFSYILGLYSQIGRKENNIKLKINIKKEDINKNIYFLDNTDNEVFINEKDKEEHHHDFLKELDESNVELYINNTKYKYQKYFTPIKEGIYDILLKFKINIRDCNFMFYNCSNIIDIDLSEFNSENVINMLSMFEGCSNLINIDLTEFNSKNVKTMSCMFVRCKKLISIDLSSFDTRNVNNLFCMFQNCQNLTNINLSSFNTDNITNMAGMFYNCSNLENIDLSSFTANKVTDIRYMFLKCHKLEKIDLSSMKINNNTNTIFMFKECSNLKEIKLNNNCNENVKKEIDQKITKIIFK